MLRGTLRPGREGIPNAVDANDRWVCDTASNMLYSWYQAIVPGKFTPLIFGPDSPRFCRLPSTTASSTDDFSMGAAYADSEKASKLAPSVQRESMIVVIQGYRKYLV